MLLFGIIVLLSVTPLADCACTFPISGDYETSHNGEITFNETHLYYEVNNKGFLNFECYMTSGTKYIALSEQFQVFNSYLRAVICFDITTLKTSLYQMGIYTLKLQDADYQRVKFIDTTTTITDAVACTDNTNTDKSIFMEKGTISSLTIQCPDILLGRFSYSFNDTDCLNETGYLDVCTDLTMMSYNYSYCSTIQAYSQNGSLNCLYSTTDGTTTSLYTYNLDTSPDETDYYRFTCFKVMQNGSQVVATQRPQDCLGTQTATSVDYTGATLTMTASVTCVPTTTTTAASVSSAGLIAGIAVGLIILLIIVGVIIAYCIYLKYFKKDRVEPRKGLPPTSTGQNDEEAGQFEDDMADAAEVVAVADNQPMLVSTYTGSPVNNAVKEESVPSFSEQNPVPHGMRREVSFADKIELINKQYPNGRIGSARPAPHFMRSAKRVSKTSHGQREVSISSDWQSVSHGILRQSIRSRERNIHDGYSSENEIRQEYEFDINIRVKGKVVSLENLAMDERATTARPTVLKPILKRTASKRRSNRQHTRIAEPPAILVIQPFDDLIYLTHDGNGEFAIDAVELDDDLYETKNRIEVKETEMESEVKEKEDEDQKKEPENCLTELQDIENCEEIDKIPEVETVLPNRDEVMLSIEDETNKENKKIVSSKIEGDTNYQIESTTPLIPIILDSKPPQNEKVKQQKKCLTTETSKLSDKDKPNSDKEDEEPTPRTEKRKLKGTASFVETTDNMIQREITVTNIKATSNMDTPTVVNERNVVHKLKENDSLLGGNESDRKVLNSEMSVSLCTDERDQSVPFRESSPKDLIVFTPRDHNIKEKDKILHDKNNPGLKDNTLEECLNKHGTNHITEDPRSTEVKSLITMNDKNPEFNNQTDSSSRETNAKSDEKDLRRTESDTDVLPDMDEITMTEEISRQIPPAKTKGSKLHSENEVVERTITFSTKREYSFDDRIIQPKLSHEENTSTIHNENFVKTPDTGLNKDDSTFDSKVNKPLHFHSSTKEEEELHYVMEVSSNEKRRIIETSKESTFDTARAHMTKEEDNIITTNLTSTKESKASTIDKSPDQMASDVKDEMRGVSIVKETSFERTNESSMNKTTTVNNISHRIIPNQEYIRERSKMKKQQNVSLDISRENSKHHDEPVITNDEAKEAIQNTDDVVKLQDTKTIDIANDEQQKGMKVMDLDEADIDENLRNIDLADPNCLEKVITEETKINLKIATRTTKNKESSKSEVVNSEGKTIQTETQQGIRTFSQYGMQALVRSKTEDERMLSKPVKKETNSEVKSDVKKTEGEKVTDMALSKLDKESDKPEKVLQERITMNEKEPVDLLSGARLITNTMMRSESVAKSFHRAMEYSETKTKDDSQNTKDKGIKVSKEMDKKDMQRVDGTDKNKSKTTGHTKGKNVKLKNSKSKSDKKKGGASVKRRPKHYQLMTKAAEAKSKTGANTTADEVQRDNFDKFGEEEKKLRTSKPNKFRLDNLGVSSNKRTIRKKIKKLKKESNEIFTLQSSTYVDDSLKKTFVDLSGEYAISKENRSGMNSDDDSDASDASSVWSIGSMISVRSERLSSRRGRERKRKRRRRKLYRSTSCLSRAVSVGSDSDFSDEEDPLLKVQKRAGSSARPSGSGDIRDLILKIREKSESSLKGTDKGSTPDLHKTTSGDSNSLSAEIGNIQESVTKL